MSSRATSWCSAPPYPRPATYREPAIRYKPPFLLPFFSFNSSTALLVFEYAVRCWTASPSLHLNHPQSRYPRLRFRPQCRPLRLRTLFARTSRFLGSCRWHLMPLRPPIPYGRALWTLPPFCLPVRQFRRCWFRC